MNTFQRENLNNFKIFSHVYFFCNADDRINFMNIYLICLCICPNSVTMCSQVEVHNMLQCLAKRRKEGKIFFFFIFSLRNFSINEKANVTNYYCCCVSLRSASPRTPQVGVGQQLEHSGFFSHGATAVIHGYSFMHWTTIWTKRGQLTLTPPVRSSEQKEIHQTWYLNTLLYSS